MSRKRYSVEIPEDIQRMTLEELEAEEQKIDGPEGTALRERLRAERLAIDTQIAEMMDRRVALSSKKVELLTELTKR